ncbi:MAG: hypothetical protein ACI89R_000089 [Candidatus Azotimanducaceae bacterium]|jgi:hypothetical protein
MKTQDFIHLLEFPKQINKEQTEQLEDVISTFPYFQSARAIYLKGLKIQDSFRYNQTLKTTAAYTTDRSLLFDFITSSEFVNEKITSESKEKIIKETDVIDAEVIKSLHKKITKNFSKNIEPSSDDILEIGKPLEFNKKESHSFSEWLQLTKFKPIEREEKIIQKPTNSDLIDKFIASKPKIKPVKDKVYKSAFKEEKISDNNHLMTETLAKVYLEQKKYKSAIKAYRILSLKYPEKSSFFADRIKAIELLDKE